MMCGQAINSIIRFITISRFVGYDVVLNYTLN